MELWEVFSKLMERKQVKIADIANSTGLPYTTVDSIIKKKLKDIKYSSAKKIADYFGVTPEYLYNGETIFDNAVPVSLPKNTVRIPVLGSIPAGMPVEAVEDIIEWIDIPEEWLHGERQFFGLLVKGDSMFPEYLEGDTVIIRKQFCCESGDDCAVMINDTDATLKKVHIYEDGLELEAVNPMYGKKKFTEEEVLSLPVTILGVVVELRRKKK